MPLFKRPIFERKWRRELRQRFDAKPHHGTTFRTGSGHTYTIDADGRFHGSSSSEGSGVMYVVGLSEVAEGDELRLVSTIPGHHPRFIKKKIEPYMRRRGEPPAKGKRLLVVFKPGSKRTSILTSSLAEDPARGQ